MVSNYERIAAEIRDEASRIAPELQLDPEVVFRLAMKVVDLEDQHRVKALPRINRDVQSLIQNATPVHPEVG